MPLELRTHVDIPMKAPILLRLFATLALLSLAQFSFAQPYPSKPVRIVVPVPPGGLVDVVVRVLAQKMGEVMAQSVVVDNRPGASTNIGMELVARAQGDGYTLLSNSLPLVINPGLFPKLSFSVEKDFAPVSMVVTAPSVIIAHPSLPAKSVKELIALAKSKPGTLKYASAGNGTNLHVAAELLKNLAGIDLVHVPYRGGGPALTAVLGGECELSFLSLNAVLPQITAGRLRALAITSSSRSPAVPDIPTVAESGVPGYEFSGWVGILAPASTPADTVAAIRELIVKAMRAPGVVERFAREGAEVIANSPSEYRAQIKIELARWAKVVKENQLTAD